jgi:predicted amidohydrolase YtcJ
MDNQADVVFINGSVLTMDAEDRICEAVAVSGNRIIRVGLTNEVNRLVGPQTDVIDLKDRSLLPGFIDAHCHAGDNGSQKSRSFCSPRRVKSIEDIKQEIRKLAAMTPKDEWILGRGYDDTKLIEKRHPTRWDFDEVAPEHKVFITRTCGHISVANSKTLEEFGISRNTPDPPGGKINRDDQGEPTGVLLEHAQIPIRSVTQPSYDELEKGMAIMDRDFLRNGITSAHDASGRNADEIRLFQKGISNGQIHVRLYFMVRISGSDIQLGKQYLDTGLITGFGNEKLRLGALKLQMDGSGGGRSAAMRTPYPGDPENYGVLHMSQDELDELVCQGNRAGYQVGVHAIGDRAVEMTLESFERALRKNPFRDHRHRIEHCGFLDDPIMDRIRDLGIVPVLGLPFLYELGDSYIKNFGQDRLIYAYPLRSLLERGIRTPLSSDAPVIDPNPIHGIYFAVTRKTESGQIISPNEAVSVLQAIRAYTIDGAYASHEEDIKGSIETGKLADLIVLSHNILDTPKEEILQISVDLTMIDGRIVYEMSHIGADPN